MPERGDTLTHFRLVERSTDEGGAWWRAVDTRLDREVVLRILSHSAERLGELQDTARRIAELSHPGIVPLEVAVAEDGTLFVTSPPPQGTSLAELLAPRGLPRERLLSWSLALTGTLGVAHGHGLVHSELEPTKITIDREGALRVRGFGLAEPQRDIPAGLDPAEVPTLTLSRDHAGPRALAYRSPEQIRGKTVDARSDVFAVGVILYEMATGRRPFAGDTPADVCVAILRDPPRPVTELNPALPVELGRTIRRSLEKDPARRFASARELHDELSRLAAA